MTNEWWSLGTQITMGGNDLWRIGVLFGVIILALGAGKFSQRLFMSAAGRWENQRRPVAAVALRAIARAVGFIGAAIGLRIGLNVMVLNSRVANFADTGADILIVFTLFWTLYCLVDVIDFWLTRKASQTPSKLDDMLVPIVRTSLRVTIVILALLQIGTILSDKPITSLLAGLGVGGLAVALAAQDTLKNFFGSIAIFADKPFEMGDRIVVDGHDGPVEQVGFRSTRIRTLEGHLITIPNSEMASKTIQNIGKRPYIRRRANITITYDTPPDKVKRALEIIKEILKDHEGMRPDFPPRVYFDEFNADSLNIVVFYWYHPPQYWDYAAFNERVNMSILRRFNEEGIEFAFPTQTIHLANTPVSHSKL
ncbi:MAG: mechanosensitive ion channel family protein [Verrucomicrobia bacterium]|nr:mechanosensitive ion channel family protein [Verrucomicrobiota bacterium]MBU4247203.1 mechanosensitive ion channel family protein [Verrucomicrobiota bacterium]MBU4291374.1 mechanosensitive ion channel family protein [Verrucomicrobiota bacterium]MBU4497698.1 mechanosensitive ion channel family protein [Verrucomicrobiota bacterium]MCG2680662.1 mechanosensitive ion channel family protein [Kiritimatiellia bacterium]